MKTFFDDVLLELEWVEGWSWWVFVLGPKELSESPSPKLDFPVFDSY